MVITLIGYRGSGKTTVAGPLARRLGWQAIDADDEIERRAGKPIAEIFAEEGEPYFRDLEKDVMADLLGRDRVVIAAGGGAVLDPETRRRMDEAGPVVWLQAPIDVLEARIARDFATAARRPNLTALDGRAEIEQMLAEREPLYRQCADMTVDAARLSVDEIVAAILREHGGGAAP